MTDPNNLPSWLNLIASGAAAVAAILSWKVQQSISKREARRIVLDIYERFFTRDECRKIIREIERSQGKRFWYFLGESGSQGELDEIDLDEYLGYFELLGALWCRKAIYIEDVYDLFGYYIEAAWKHQTIREYIEKLRLDKDAPNIYEHFERIANEVTHGRVGRQRRPLHQWIGLTRRHPTAKNRCSS